VNNKKPHDDKIDRFQVAPMLDITNKYWRFLARLLTKKATLWTEMIHQDCILFHKLGYKIVLDYLPCESKLVLQIGGNDPEKLRKCAILAEEMGYDEVNLNVGCPSDKYYINIL
jgi:tRNA-dihydrouridine synthase A